MSTAADTLVNRSQAEETGPDLRSWLSTLNAANELRHITAPVDWDQEIGAITRANLALGGPALLFENIIGHESTRCTKLLTSGIGNRRQIQLMLGLGEKTGDWRSCGISRMPSRSRLRPGSCRPDPSRRTSSPAMTSTCGSSLPRNGMPRMGVATSIRSAVWSPRTG